MPPSSPANWWRTMIGIQLQSSMVLLVAPRSLLVRFLGHQLRSRRHPYGHRCRLGWCDKREHTAITTITGMHSGASTSDTITFLGDGTANGAVIDETAPVNAYLTANGLNASVPGVFSHSRRTVPASLRPSLSWDVHRGEHEQDAPHHPNRRPYDINAPSPALNSHDLSSIASNHGKRGSDNARGM
jgi:hypothetical protein